MAKQKAPFPVRLSDETLEKLRAVAVRERRKTSEMGRIFIEDGLAAYEAQRGEIKLPTKP